MSACTLLTCLIVLEVVQEVLLELFTGDCLEGKGLQVRAHERLKCSGITNKVLQRKQEEHKSPSAVLLVYQWTVHIVERCQSAATSTHSTGAAKR